MERRDRDVASVNARIFVAEILSCDTAAVEPLLAFFRCEGVPVQLVDAGRDPELWQASGLRSIPAVELRVGGTTVRSYAGELSEHVLRDGLRTLCNETPPDEPVRRFCVVASSGCHRYGRWNEQALSSPSEANGWSTVSHREPTTEFLVFDLYREWSLCGLELHHRAWAHCVDYRLSFPETLTISISLDARSWQQVTAIQSDGSAPDVRRLRWFPAPARHVRLDIGETRMRPDGKFFTQVARVRFWHRPESRAVGLSPAFGQDVDIPAPEQPVKRGLMWSKSHSVERWHLAPGQELPWRVLPRTEVLWVVLGGSAAVAWLVSPGDERTRRLGSGATAMIPPGVAFRIAAPADAHAILLSVTSGNRFEIWSARAAASAGVTANR